MQRKSLPELLENLLKPLRRVPQEPKIIDSTQEELELVGFEDKSSKNNYYYEKKFVSFLANTSIILVSIFIVLLFVNLILTGYLNELKSQTDILIADTDNYTQDIAWAKQISEKTDFYKRVVLQRPLIGDKTSILFADLGPGITIKSANLTFDKFSVMLNVTAPRYFAELTTKYINSNKIGEISIKRADLVSSNRSFNVELEGTFK